MKKKWAKNKFSNAERQLMIGARVHGKKNNIACKYIYIYIYTWQTILYYIIMYYIHFNRVENTPDWVTALLVCGGGGGATTTTTTTDDIISS